MVAAGSNGLLVPPGDVEAVTGALRTLLSEPQERAAMGARALQYVRQQASSEHCLRKLEAFYLDVVNRGR